MDMKVDAPAARQAYIDERGPEAEAKHGILAGAQHLERLASDRGLNAPSRQVAAIAPVREHGHMRPRRPWRPAVGAHDCNQGTGQTAPPAGRQQGERSFRTVAVEGGVRCAR